MSECGFSLTGYLSYKDSMVNHKRYLPKNKKLWILQAL